MNATVAKPIPLSRKILYSCLRILRVCALAYLGVILVLLWLENYIIYPAPKYPDGDWNADRVAAEDVYFTSSDGTKLHGWYFDRPEPRGHLLYCHGNADCVAHHAGYLKRLSDDLNVSIFSFDYRGYGRSEGSPNERGVLLDSAAAHEWLAKRANVPAGNLVLMGRSLGGAAAVDLAAERGARGLILQNTFSSLPDVAAPRFWFLPVRLVMKTQYRSAEKIKRYPGPLLQSHGTADSIIPYAVGRRLYDAAPGEKTWFEIKGGDHNDPEDPPYDEALREFIERLP
jgi:fermentation-respiration switch protein FrsA (DUF1100 family)